MTTLTQTHSATGLGDRLRAAFAAWRARRAQAALARQTYVELSSLSDRELDDLGIARGEIERIARESVA